MDDDVISKRISELDFEQEFTTIGRAWTEANAAGNAVLRDPVVEERARRITRVAMGTMAISGKALPPDQEERLYRKVLAAERAKRSG